MYSFQRNHTSVSQVVDLLVYREQGLLVIILASIVLQDHSLFSRALSMSSMSISRNIMTELPGPSSATGNRRLPERVSLDTLV